MSALWSIEQNYFGVTIIVSGASPVAQVVKSLPAMQETWV